MCAGAMLLARLGRLVWGAPNNRAGADGSWVALLPPEGSSAGLGKPCRSDKPGLHDADACGACCGAAHEPSQSAGTGPEAVAGRSTPAGPSGGQTGAALPEDGPQGGVASSTGNVRLEGRRGGWPAAVAGALCAALHPRAWLAGAPARDSRAEDARGARSRAALVEGPHQQMQPTGRARGLRGSPPASADLHCADRDAAKNVLLDTAVPPGSAEARQSGEAAGPGAESRAAGRGASADAEQRPWRPHATHPTLQARRTQSAGLPCGSPSSLCWLCRCSCPSLAGASARRVVRAALQPHDRLCGAC